MGTNFQLQKKKRVTAWGIQSIMLQYLSTVTDGNTHIMAIIL